MYCNLEKQFIVMIYVKRTRISNFIKCFFSPHAYGEYHSPLDIFPLKQDRHLLNKTIIVNLMRVYLKGFQYR